MSKRVDEYTEIAVDPGASALGARTTGETVRYPIGTAASADVTTSATDTTAGRVMKVGDFGLGGQAILPSSGTSIDDHTIPNGIYRWSSVTPGTVPNAAPDGIWMHIRREDGARAHQIAFQQSTLFFYFRTWVGSAWTSWAELYHSGNYPSDTAWTATTTLLNGWTGTVRYIKRAGMVTVIGTSINGASRSADTLLNLLAAYRPGVQVEFVVLTSAGTAIRGILETGGNLRALSTDTAQFFTITYPVI